MARTDLLKMFLGITIIVALCVFDWNAWHSVDSYMMRRNIHRTLLTGVGITLLWMYWKWENRG